MFGNCKSGEIMNNWEISELPSAVLIGEFENGSEEWHELRSQGVGGSQVGTCLGLNPWESAFSAWARAVGAFEPKESSLAMRLGNLFEPVIKDAWLSENPGWTIYETGTWQSSKPGFEWCHANPDGIMVDENGELHILEVKMSRYPWDVVPAHYRAQVLWYMNILGIHKAKLVALFGGNDIQTFDIEWSEFEAETNVMLVKRWWDCVLEERQPEWDGSTSTYEMVRFLHPDIDPDASVELGQLGVELSLAQTEFDKADTFLRELKSRTLDAMGSAKTGTVDGLTVATRSARGGGLPYLTIKK
jgi:putative phage-type endonuclease